MCQLQLFLLVTLLITVLVSHNVIFFEYFMPMSHGINKKAPTMTCCFTSNNLSTFFCSDLTDYQRNNAFSK